MATISSTNSGDGSPASCKACRLYSGGSSRGNNSKKTIVNIIGVIALLAVIAGSIALGVYLKYRRDQKAAATA